MVELPSGKMKSREGTVVDADDLVDEMVEVARKMSEELGKLDALSEQEASKIYRIIALGALKYFILKVDPKKNMMFNPEESIDFNGNTGTFIQYTYTRIQSVKRKAQEKELKTMPLNNNLTLSEKEKGLVKRISQFPEIVKDAGKTYSPALIANYCYELTREYNQFYYDHSILSEPDADVRNLRLMLSETVGKILGTGMGLLGITMPDRM
jgi:arginyl-tRNA synthetase